MLLNTIPSANSVLLTSLITDADNALLTLTTNKSQDNVGFNGDIPYANRSILIQNNDSANSIWFELYKDAVVGECIKVIAGASISFKINDLEKIRIIAETADITEATFLTK